MGPSTQPPINIEVSSENFESLTKTAVDLKNYLEKKNIPGIERAKLDIDLNNPEATISVDRERATTQGHIHCPDWYGNPYSALREGSFAKLKLDEDEYKIQLRNNELQRKSCSDLNACASPTVIRGIGLRSREVPISSVVNSSELTSSYGSIKA